MFSMFYCPKVQSAFSPQRELTFILLFTPTWTWIKAKCWKSEINYGPISCFYPTIPFLFAYLFPDIFIFPHPESQP